MVCYDETRKKEKKKGGGGEGGGGRKESFDMTKTTSIGCEVGQVARHFRRKL